MEPHALIQQIQRLGERERAVFVALLERTPVAKDTNAVFAKERTFGEKLADHVAAFGGSWTFIILFMTAMAAWILWNNRSGAFDPFPFILLNLVLSCLAAL